MEMTCSTDQRGVRRIVNNTLWNFVGQGVPMVAAVFTIPLLIEDMGTARFGILLLAWAVIGYFSLFDMGLGRAMTQLVAERQGSGRDEEVPSLVWTALIMMVSMGAAGAAVLSSLSPFLVGSLPSIPEELHAESLATFRLLCLSIPLVILGIGLNGVLEARQMFRQISYIRIFLGAVTFLGPLAVLHYSDSLTAVVAVLVAGRAVAAAGYAYLCFIAVPGLDRPGLAVSAVRPLMQFGGWMTVSNLLSPLMVYMDRFLVGSIISVAAVSYYATPYELVTRLWIIPGALVGVLFPAFAQAGARGAGELSFLFGRGLKYVFIAMFPLTLVIVGLAYEGVDAWLGAEFAVNSSTVLKWLAAGVFLNSLARVPFTLLQGVGRPDITARLHILEIPFYLGALWLLTAHYGITGAAAAWSLRIGAELAMLLFISGRAIKNVAHLVQTVSWCTCGALLMLALAAVPMGLSAKGAMLLVALGGFAAAAWRFALAPDERMWFRLRPILGFINLR